MIGALNLLPIRRERRIFAERHKHKLQLAFSTFLLALAAWFPAFGQEAGDDSAGDEESGADPGYRYLLKEAFISVNSKGLTTRRLHNRVEIQKQHAVDTVGDVHIPYNAFRSEARVIKAFTRTADGRTVQLKKEAVHDLMPEEISSCQMYSDVHQLSFSMPALGKGAVMDYEVVIEGKNPVMAGEFWVSEFLDAGAQVCTSRVAVAFPPKREVRLVATNLSAQAMVSDTTNGNVRTVAWEMRNVPALEYERGMPPYSSVRAQIHLTSVKSWQQVVEWYAGLAKKHLRPDDEIQRQVRTLVSGRTNKLDQIQALYRHASRDVRYVGVELGRGAYEPHSPREALRNKYGDCKDKAALLVSMLNAIDIPAYIAIVRPNDEGPVDQSLPGPEQFNHAIVYVPREQGDLWIDATEPFGEVTEHSYHLDGVDALVVGLAGKTFVRVPVPDETHSVHRLVFEVDVHYGGLCTVHESQEFTGRAAISERARRSRFDTDKIRKQLEHNLNSGSGYGRVLNYSFTDPTNDCGSVRVNFDYDSSSFLTPTKGGLSVRFDASELREWLDVPRADPASVRKQKRNYPWEARMAHTEEIICHLHLAQGYELAHTPSETYKNLPHGKAEMLFDKSGGVPCLTLRVIAKPVRLQPAELSDVAKQVDGAISRLRASLEIEDSVNALIREHRYAKAEVGIVEAARRDPNSTDALLRLGVYYKTVGRVFQSRQAFEKVIALAPEDPRGYEMLAGTFSGWWGMPGEGFDRKSIMAIYDRALTNVPVRAWTIHQKASFCLISDLGQGDCTEHLDEAGGYFRELLKEDAQNYNGLFGLGQVNRLRGNYDDAEDYYAKAGRAQPHKVEPRAGTWISMAYAGRAEEAWNAMSAYYGPGEQMNTEAVRVASLLTIARRYESAAKLYDRLVESAARPEVIQKLARLMRKLEKAKRDNYEEFYDDSSPEGVVRTLLIASVMGDTNRAFRCLSPAVSRDGYRRLMQAQASLLKMGVIPKLGTNYFADIMLGAFEVSKRTLDNGDVEVKLDGSKSAAAALSSFGSVVTMQAQRAGDRWQAITTSEPGLDCATFGRLAFDALDRGDIAQAGTWQSRLADLIARPSQGRPLPPLARHLQEVAFTNEVLRIKAWAGMSLAGSQDRADNVRGVACLEEVAAAYPDDSLLKLAIAYAEAQLGNLRKAAAILDTINPSNLAGPDQVSQLGDLEIRLEKIDGVDKAASRLREVAPDNEQLIFLQGQALTYRAKFSEAVSTLAKLRDRSRLNTPLSIPSECLALSHSDNQASLRDFIEHWREPEKPIAAFRPLIGRTCLALGLTEEASEQIATMLAEGGLNVDALVGYAEIALVRGDTAEARHLVSVANHLAKHSIPSIYQRSLALVNLALGNYNEAAHVYHDDAISHVSQSSGYSLYMSALASRLAGDTTTAADSLKLAAAMQGDSDWPRLAIQYISGEISEEQFRRAPERTTATPLMHASRVCEINCTIGLLKEANHDLPGALAAYEAAVATKSVTDLEHLIARLALQRLRTDPPGRSEEKQATL